MDMLMPPLSCTAYRNGTVSVDLPQSLECYLMAVMQMENLYSMARVKDIACEMGCEKSSVVGALKRLEARGVIVYPAYHPIRLTREGRRLAEYIGWRRGILVRFFTTVLHIQPNAAKRSANRIGHALDGEVIERMRRFLNETYVKLVDPFDV